MAIHVSTSVVIPTFNGTPFLRDAVESVFAQTLLPLEIIVVDDASTDGTVELVTAIGRTAPVPMRVIPLTTNSGDPAHPLNVGMQAARGTYVALIEQDDRMCHTKIATTHDLFSRYPEAGLAFGQYRYLRPDGNIDPPEPGLYACFPPEVSCLSATEAYHSLLDGYLFGGAGGAAINKAVWQAVGRFSEKYRVVWDFEYALRVVSRGFTVAYAPQTVYYRRFHSQNLSRRDGGVRCLCETARVLMEYVEGQPVAGSRRSTSVQALSSRILGAAYWERQRGEYRQALKNYRFALRSCGAVGPAFTGLLKLLLTAGLRPRPGL